jgi:actin-related protein
MVQVGKEWGGLHDMVVESIGMSDIDLRRTLYQNILLSGNIGHRTHNMLSLVRSMAC